MTSLGPAWPERAAWGTATSLRAWQSAAMTDYAARSPRDYLAVATPGAGKTTFALTVAGELLAPRAGEPCGACGRIASIREITTTGTLPPATVAPVPGGGAPGNPTQQNLIGAVIYLPLGGGGADKPYIGGVGTPEMYARLRETTYEITLRMDDGTFRFVRRADGAAAFGVGDRVRWLGGDELELLAN